ncbi:MAG: DNA translocase FtsK [Parabacteroides sp.]|nr:DNA translocase FtsK [Parabacteroides sp.]
MAKKSAAKKDDSANLWSLLGDFFTNERTRFITGLIFAIITIYAGLALISFFFTGGIDQSKIDNVPLKDLITNHGAVANWTGVRGAVLSDLLMNRLFGVSSFFMLFFLGAFGVKLMNLKKISLLRQFIFCSVMTLWGSLFFAFTFIQSYEDSFIYLGGQHGFYMSQIMINNIGIPGTILFLAGSLLIIIILSSKRTVPFLQRLFSLSWIKRKPKEDKEETNIENTIVNPIASEQPDEQPEIDSEFDTPKEDDNSHFEVTVPKEEESYIVPDQAGKGNALEQENLPDENDPAFSVEVPAGEDENYDASSIGEYDPKLDLSSFRNPPIDLLKKYDVSEHQVDMDEQNTNQKRIKQTLESFGISIASIKATVGPTVTLYEVIPDTGVRISKIKNLEDDIALNLSALGIRIIAPMPGKGTIGIEVPNKDPQIVSMQSVISTRKFQENKYDLPVVLGKTITNEVFMFDLCKMPHLLVAGATGQGKSVGLNAIITSLLYRKHPSELKFVLVDPKMVEFGIYAGLERHYMAKLPDVDKAVITDCTKVVMTLKSICKEMDDRYELLMKAHVRNIKEYNAKFISRHLNPEKGHHFMPFIVVIIDEYGDLIMQAGKDIELPIARIAQKARAVGIHMVIATQRPSTNIITGIIKANFPARMAFRVMQMVDSRTILDAPGANQLIGRGDLLFSQGGETTRVQCAFVDTPEVEQIVNYISQQAGYPTAYLLPEYIDEDSSAKTPGAVDLSDRDPLFEEAARLIVIQQQGSTSLIQRKFSIGYNRAGRIMDQMEAAGIVGPFEGSKARQVLMPDEYSLEQLLNSIK